MTNSLKSQKFQWHSFDELSSIALYDLLKLREQVFMLEQNSLYADLDDLDQQSMHLLISENDELCGYLRLFSPTSGVVKLGRVVLAQSARGQGLGPKLIQAGLDKAAELYPSHIMKISAQLGLEAYYQRFGFIATSEPYDDGGVLHLDMQRQL